MIFQSSIYLVLGGALLYFGASWMVSGSTALARLYSIPSIIIGLTVVAYGTSAPEIVVSVQASLSGHSEIALGNVIGSNIANIGLILGVSALIVPAKVSGALMRREVPVLLTVTVLMLVFLYDGIISRLEGVLLFAVGVSYTIWMIIDGKKIIREAREGLSVVEDVSEEAGQIEVSSSKSRAAVLAFIGLVVLICGGSLFVNGASQLALLLGMSERLVGLTIVAVGTSLPELAASLIAAWRGHSDIAVGNVVGSNIFNIVLCLGLAAMISPISSPTSIFTFDNLMVLTMTIVAAYMIRKDRHVTRAEGATLLCTYIVFLTLVAAQ